MIELNLITKSATFEDTTLQFGSFEGIIVKQGSVEQGCATNNSNTVMELMASNVKQWAEESMVEGDILTTQDYNAKLEQLLASELEAVKLKLDTIQVILTSLQTGENK